MSEKKPVPGKDGNKYVPYSERSGETSVVYFTRDLSPEGLKKIFDRVSEGLTGKLAVKLHTGEAQGPNIIPRPWVRALIEDRSPMRQLSRPTHTMRDPATRQSSTVKL